MIISINKFKTRRLQVSRGFSVAYIVLSLEKRINTYFSALYMSDTITAEYSLLNVSSLFVDWI